MLFNVLIRDEDGFLFPLYVATAHKVNQAICDFRDSPPPKRAIIQVRSAISLLCLLLQAFDSKGLNKRRSLASGQ
jgi:hypothetical protein